MHLSPSLKPRQNTALALLVVAGVVAAPAVAFAHAVLTAPKPRDNRDDHKDTNGGAPCGIARATSQPGNALTPGAMFNVTWNETVNHPGCFVIDFAASGDTGWQVLSTVAHNGAAPNPTSTKPRMYSQMVTLPSAPCTACTLRLRQIMLTAEPAAGATCPPANLATNSTYYTCANVAMDGGGTTGTGGSGAGTGGGSGAGTGGRGGTGGGARTGGMTGSSGGTPGSGGATTSSGGATNPGSGGAVTSSGGATNPGSGGAITSSGGASNPGSGGATNPGSGGATTTPGTGGAAGGPGGTADEPPPPCACGVATPRSLATGALLFGLLLGMTVVRGRARRKTKHNQ